MKQNTIYDAVSGISEEYLTQSEQFSAVSSGFRRERRMRLRTAALCCCALAGLAASALYAGRKPARTEPLRQERTEAVPADHTEPVTQERTEAGTVSGTLQQNGSALTDAQSGTVIQPAQTVLTQAEGSRSAGTSAPENTTDRAGQNTAVTQNDGTQKQPVSDLLYGLFPSTVKSDPDKDAYAEEQYPRVMLHFDGKEYRQADAQEPEDLADFAAFPSSGGVPESAFGAYLGSVTELKEYDHPLKSPCSQEPSLKGAEVYEYAPAGSRAVLLVRQGTQCSVFLYHGYLIGNGFADAFRFYNAEIVSAAYTVRTPDGTRMKKTAEGLVTDPAKLRQIQDVLESLTPQGPLPQGIGTPQWEITAREAFRNHPGGKTREDISLVIRFANGTVMRNMEFQPYIGNGWFSGMEQMTLSQNQTLRGLLT